MLRHRYCESCGVAHLYCDRCRSHCCHHVMAALGAACDPPDLALARENEVPARHLAERDTWDLPPTPDLV